MATVELFKYNKFYNTVDNNVIKNFTIYGERHSGTNWTEKLINKTFHIPITWDYDHKHFFGCCSWNKLNRANNTLFIGIVRNIYNWIGGMKKIPYHLASNALLDIKPWQSTKGLLPHHSYCDSHWYTKEKYKDIFDMRHHKIQFIYLYMPYLVNNYIFIRYEDLIKYTYEIMYLISDIYNLKFFSNKYLSSDKTKLTLYNLSHNYCQTINSSTIWTTENMIGYKKIDDLDKNYTTFQETGLTSRYQ